jgi:hypothetical protein
MFRLRIWSKSFEEIATLTRPTATELIGIGKVLQKAFGAYYRLEYIGKGG